MRPSGTCFNDFRDNFGGTEFAIQARMLRLPTLALILSFLCSAGASPGLEILEFEQDYASVKTQPEKLIQMLSSLDGQQEELHGPNCFSTSMMIQGMISVNRQMQPSELFFWLKSPLCRELNLLEEPRTGDMIFLPQDGGHLFTWIRPDLVFEKECYFKTCKYQFNSLNRIFNSIDWKVKPECQRVSYSHRPDGCYQTASYYRCESSFAQELKAPGRATPEIIHFHQELLALEKSAMRQMRQAADMLSSTQINKAATLPMRKGIEKSILEMKAGLNSVKRNNPDAKYTFFLTAFELRLEELYRQIKMYSLINDTGIWG